MSASLHIINISHVRKYFSKKWKHFRSVCIYKFMYFSLSLPPLSLMRAQAHTHTHICFSLKFSVAFTKDVWIMLIEMVTHLTKLQIVAFPIIPPNAKDRHRPRQRIAHTHSREIKFAFAKKKCARLSFVENTLVRWNVRGKRVTSYYRGIHFI